MLISNKQPTNQSNHATREPFFSVITASFNQGHFLESAIQSVINQKYPDFEHIIVDNESNDCTPEVIAKYPHLIFICEKDSGQSDAFNKGIERAKGDYIFWLNCDDLIASDSFQRFAEVIKRNSSYDVLYGHIVFIDEKDNYIKRVYHIPFFYSLTFFTVYAPPSTGSLFKSDIFKKNRLACDYHYSMDTVWYLQNGRKLKTKLINKDILFFRVGRNKTGSDILFHKPTPMQIAERQKYQNEIILPKISRNTEIAKIIFKIFRPVMQLFYYVLKIRYAKSILFDRHNFFRKMV